MRQNSATTNFGLTGTLDAGTATNAERQSFLKIDLSAINAVKSAILRLNGAASSGTPTISVYPVSDTSWGETTITWNNQPAPGSTALASTPVTGATPTWYEWDVSAYAKAEKAAGRNVITLMLKQTATGTPGAQFNSREGSSNPPYLLVEQRGVYFIHTDHLNTPRAITNSTGQLVWTWANDDPFGANAPNENPSGAGNFTCNLRLPGQYFDKETNLHYNYFRDYDPGIGRYVESDPIGLIGGINTYLYVEANPLKTIDPLGLYELAPGIPPPSAQLDKVLNCIEGCLGTTFTVTSTTRPGGQHARGLAADIRYRGPANSPFNADRFLCCASGCGVGFALDEFVNPSPGATGPHIHIQIPPGLRGGRGNLPPRGCDKQSCGPANGAGMS